ncbi:MAG TPA: energy-coupling factor transporter transmembrane component T, partial [Jiangellales bacterium]|nr:energy-coupling factor transporter transmembrane component T [Jiangellales bacterium]
TAQAGPDAPIARRSPLAKIAAALLPGLALLASIDPVAPAVVLAATLLCVPLCGVRWRALARRAWPLALAVVTLSLGNAVFTGHKGGTTLLDVGPLLLTTESIAVGGAAGIRVAAIALPGVLAILTIDPVDLADALVQQLRVPARFAYGALAGFRLAPLLAADWQTLGRARRARGLAAGANPVRAIGLFAGKVFALLVGAVRRATRLAAAMEARGFDSGRQRTAARAQRFDSGDVALLAAAAVVTAAAVGLSVATGAWDPLLS